MGTINIRIALISLYTIYKAIRIRNNNAQVQFARMQLWTCSTNTKRTILHGNLHMHSNGTCSPCSICEFFAFVSFTCTFPSPSPPTPSNDHYLRGPYFRSLLCCLYTPVCVYVQVCVRTCLSFVCVSMTTYVYACVYVKSSYVYVCVLSCWKR